MVISGFSMCCGYYDKILSNDASIIEFYSKRYSKVLPFFSLLCFMDFIISPSKNALYEIFANLTLCFGLLPIYDITVIGVGWFLGVVFVFYFIFPFYCYLLFPRRKAWLSLVIALIFNYLCEVRFNAGRTNIIYCGVFFILGGIIFLYRESLERIIEKKRLIVFCCVLIGTIGYFVIAKSTIIMLFLFASMLIYTLKSKTIKSSLLNNWFVKCISKISLEIYLSHMVIYRILEKLCLLHLFKSELLSFIVICILTLIGAVAFSIITSNVIKYIVIIYKRKKLEKGIKL